MSALDGVATGTATGSPASAESTDATHTTGPSAASGAVEAGDANGAPVTDSVPDEDSGAPEAAAAASGSAHGDGAGEDGSTGAGGGGAGGVDAAGGAGGGGADEADLADGGDLSGGAGSGGADEADLAAGGDLSGGAGGGGAVEADLSDQADPSGGVDAAGGAGDGGADEADLSDQADPSGGVDAAGGAGGSGADEADLSGRGDSDGVDESERPGAEPADADGDAADLTAAGAGAAAGEPEVTDEAAAAGADSAAQAVDAPETGAASDSDLAAAATVVSGVDSAAGPVVRAVPALGPVPRAKQPASDERVLASGLRVIAIRRPGVPLVELRLRVPFGGTVRTLPARSTVLGETMLSGTEHRSQVELAAALQAIGADLHVSVDSDRLLLGGAVLRGGLPQLLELLAEVLTAAAYPNREVAGERARLIERLSIARSQPAVLVREALRRRLYGDHPYARELPSVDEVAAVTPPQVRRLHTERVTPAGAVLVAVGDVTPARALDQIEAALTDWRAGLPSRGLPALPAIEPGPTLVVDRPGSVQSSIRLAGPALPRDHADYPALQLANLVFGGYFSSRLVENIREDKGYTYGPHSRIDHGSVGSTLVIDADVSTEVTAPALLETRYELGRMATLPVSETELADVRQYAIGTLALSLASQSGLASTLAALAGSDLGLTWLREHPQRLAEVTVEDITRVSRQFLAPGGLVTVILGDAAKIEGPLATLGPVRPAPAEEADRS
jgi:zinc protease